MTRTDRLRALATGAVVAAAYLVAGRAGLSLAVANATLLNPSQPYDFVDERPVLVVRFAGGGTEQRASLLSRELRRYPIRIQRGSADRIAIDAFFRARGWQLDSFLYKDVIDYSRTTIALGNSVASQTVFEIPDTGEYGGDYPIDQASTLLFDDGVEVVGEAALDRAA